ncbi:hypothetical protein [Ectobacillus ponti]|uniref:Uncharacterized protein n=1 Tax=Ectobacillus ponti TaxID=2961894 RepID=A0AA42BRJ3_9BACI|nr:hypothetical protein [Ectobacillus ponti]MCP8969549.1 hypothetical protein [Ectobacillus ponti]
MKKQHKMLAGGLAFTLLFAQGMYAADAKGKEHKKSKKPVVTDKNRDGIVDSWEVKYKLGLGKAVAKQDTDRDGLSNLVEYKLHLNPRSADTDHDGILDNDEDADRDGLTNELEIDLGQNPSVADSDHDGVKDGAEDADKNGVSDNADLQELQLEMKLASGSLELKYERERGRVKAEMEDETGQFGDLNVQSFVKDLALQSTMTTGQVLDRINQALGTSAAQELELKVKFSNGQKLKAEYGSDQENADENEGYSYNNQNYRYGHYED